MKAVLEPTGKYEFIGEQPFEVTNWDPALSQQVLTAAISRYPEIDVIVSDFGPSLVGALPEFEKAGRSIPPMVASDGNVLGCFWEENKDANPEFQLFTIATGNDHVRTAMQYAIAQATGGEVPESTQHQHALFENSVSAASRTRSSARRTCPATSTCPRRCRPRSRPPSWSRTRTPVGAGAPSPGTDRSPDPHPDPALRRRRGGRAGRDRPGPGARRRHRAAARRRRRQRSDRQPVPGAPARRRPQALRRRRRPGRGVLRRPSRRGPRPARRERGRQVDAHGRRLGHHPPRRGHRARRRRGRRPASRRPSPRSSASPSSTSTRPCCPTSPSRRTSGSPCRRARLSEDGDRRATMRAILDSVGFTGHLDDRVGSLSVARKHLLELAKALAQRPRVLILDEPTAPLGGDSVDLLFERVRAAARDRRRRRLHHPPPRRGPRARRPGHRPAGRPPARHRRRRRRQRRRAARPHRRAAAGLHLPAQAPAGGRRPPSSSTCDGLSGHGFADVSFQVRRGEVLGVAGVVGNGQPELVRALAGLDPATGDVELDGVPAHHAPAAARRARTCPRTATARAS